jgi:hypothetical protein
MVYSCGTFENQTGNMSGFQTVSERWHFEYRASHCVNFCTIYHVVAQKSAIKLSTTANLPVSSANWCWWTPSWGPILPKWSASELDYGVRAEWVGLGWVSTPSKRKRKIRKWREDRSARKMLKKIDLFVSMLTVVFPRKKIGPYLADYKTLYIDHPNTRLVWFSNGLQLTSKNWNSPDFERSICVLKSNGPILEWHSKIWKICREYDKIKCKTWFKYIP